MSISMVWHSIRTESFRIIPCAILQIYLREGFDQDKDSENPRGPANQ